MLIVQLRNVELMQFVSEMGRFIIFISTISTESEI